MKNALLKEIEFFETKIKRLEEFIKKQPKSNFNLGRNIRIGSFKLIIFRLKRVLENSELGD